MSLLAKLLNKKQPVLRDSERIYQNLMSQSRRVEFFGQGRVSDNYDGRIDVLTLHIACVLKALHGHGEQGERLAQALFDRMKDDFEVALREEGISDTGVAKRIKPMISYFYARVKAYTDGLDPAGQKMGQKTDQDKANGSELSQAFDSLAGLEENPFLPEFKTGLIHYMQAFHKDLSQKTLGQIALCEFTYPDVSPLSA